MTQSIQGKAILKDISVDIQKGRLTSLIGPNGAEKHLVISD